MAKASPNKTEERAPQYKVQSEADCTKVKTEVTNLFGEYKQAGQTALDKVLEMGDRLWAVREFLAVKQIGAWGDWFDSNELPFGKSQANRYIKIFKEYQKDPLKFEEENKFSVRAGINIAGGKTESEKKTTRHP